MLHGACRPYRALKVDATGPRGLRRPVAAVIGTLLFGVWLRLASTLSAASAKTGDPPAGQTAKPVERDKVSQAATSVLICSSFWVTSARASLPRNRRDGGSSAATSVSSA